MRDMKKTPRAITAAEFDRKFDAGEDISAHVDWDRARVRKPNKTTRLQVEISAPTASALEREAARLGLTAEALIKVWIAERLSKAA